MSNMQAVETARLVGAAGLSNGLCKADNAKDNRGAICDYPLTTEQPMATSVDPLVIRIFVLRVSFTSVYQKMSK